MFTLNVAQARQDAWLGSLEVECVARCVPRMCYKCAKPSGIVYLQLE